MRKALFIILCFTYIFPAITAHCETINLTKQLTVEIPDGFNQQQSKNSNCVYIGNNENCMVAFYAIPISWKDKDGNEKVIKDEYQQLDIQDSLMFNVSGMELIDIEKDPWYNWSHDYVKKLFRYKLENGNYGSFCTFASRTADELIIIAVDCTDSSAHEVMDRVLKTMNHHQNFFGKWFDPRSDEGWHWGFLILSMIIVLIVFISGISVGWKIIIPLLLCAISCITMQGDWIGVLSFVVCLIILCVACLIMEALGIDIDV